MKFASIAVALVLFATPVWAADAPKPIPLSATPEEVQALDDLLALAKQSPSANWSVTNNALAWHNKLVQAVADANKPLAGVPALAVPPAVTDNTPAAPAAK